MAFDEGAHMDRRSILGLAAVLAATVVTGAAGIAGLAHHATAPAAPAAATVQASPATPGAAGGPAGVRARGGGLMQRIWATAATVWAVLGVTAALAWTQAQHAHAGGRPGQRAGDDRGAAPA